MSDLVSPQEQEQRRIVAACSMWRQRDDDEKRIHDAFCSKPTARPAEHQAYCMVREPARIGALTQQADTTLNNCALEPLEAEKACLAQRDLDQQQLDALRTFQDLAGNCPDGSKAGSSATLGAMPKLYGSHDEQDRVSTGCTVM
jgi:cell pole-organizing protein PopZ